MHYYRTNITHGNTMWWEVSWEQVTFRFLLRYDLPPVKDSRPEFQGGWIAVATLESLLSIRWNARFQAVAFNTLQLALFQPDWVGNLRFSAKVRTWFSSLHRFYPSLTFQGFTVVNKLVFNNKMRLFHLLLLTLTLAQSIIAYESPVMETVD